MKKQSKSHKHPSGLCALCGQFHDFDLPDYLKTRLYEGNVAVFVGAGVSTENEISIPITLYEQIKEELGIDSKDKVSFSSLMEKFCAQVDGRSRLLQIIKSRFDYVESYPETYRRATRFHSELSTIYQIQTIVTTNWDDYFERECGATPFVIPQDFAFVNLNGRKVLKIHGSISNLSTIVVTNDDYEKCYKRLRDGILGAKLKELLGTKTIVYIGYSYNDSDFKQIQNFLAKEMKEIFPHSYFVSPDNNITNTLNSTKISHIKTDGTHFLSVLKQHAVSDGQLVDDKQFSDIAVKHNELMSIQNSLLKQISAPKHPSSIYCGVYQDGFLHALQRSMLRKKTGEYSKPKAVRGWIDDYIVKRAKELGERSYVDVAYIDGYIAGLKFIDADSSKRKRIPVFYIYGAKSQPKDLHSYKLGLKNAMRFDPEATAFAERTVQEEIQGTSGLSLYHAPFL